MDKKKSSNIWLYLKLAPLLIIVLTLMIWGIYLGEVYRPQVLKFEHDFLGMDVGDDSSSSEVAHQLQEKVSSGKKPSSPQKGPPTSAHDKPKHPVAEHKTAPDHPSIPSAPDRPKDIPHQTTPSSNPSESPQQASPQVVESTPPGDPDLDDSRQLPVTIRVMVLVDKKYTDNQTDWMSGIQQTINEASRIYHYNFGIKLDLVGLVCWPTSVSKQTIQQIYSSLSQRSRYGADVLLGLINRELSAYEYAQGNPVPNEKNNGAFGIVGRTDDAQYQFLRGTLRSLGHLLGAIEVSDTTSEDYRLGSWMSGKRVPDGRLFWIDNENRRRILERKTKPFLPIAAEASDDR